MVNRLYSGWKKELYSKALREGRENTLSEMRQIRKDYLKEAYQPQNTVITAKNLDAKAIHSVGFDWGKTIEEMKECLIDEN